MKTSATESAAEPTLIVFADEAGTLGCWLRLDGGEASASGEVAAGLPADRSRTVLVVPGEQVAVHWLELADGLTEAQAAAAARLLLADASAEPLADMHVAVGRPERGLTPVALAPARLMSGWLDAAQAAGLDPATILPSPLLLAPPATGFVRREVSSIWDYRGAGAAFAMEPDLAACLVGEAPLATIAEPAFEAGLAPVLDAPPLNLRQGAFGRRRRWRLQGPRLRRVAALAIALALLTLTVQVATILSYTFAADRLRAEADETLAVAAPGDGADRRPGFGAAASILFEAVRATPNVEIARLDYRADGSLAATVMLDNPATFEALRARLEQAGLSVEPGERRSAGGRPTADLTLRPA